MSGQFLVNVSFTGFTNKCNSYQRHSPKCKGSGDVPYFRFYDLRSAYATRLSTGDVADEWVIQMLRQGDSQVFKYSQMKLRMKREALDKINRRANEMSEVLTQPGSDERGFDTVLT